MAEIDEKEAAMLVTLIYRPELADEFLKVQKRTGKCTVKDLIDYSEAKLRNKMLMLATCRNE